MKRLLNGLFSRKRLPRKSERKPRPDAQQPMILSFDGRVVRLRLPE